MMFRTNSNTHPSAPQADAAQARRYSRLAAATFTLSLAVTCAPAVAANNAANAAGPNGEKKAAKEADKEAKASASAEENGSAISTSRRARDPFVVPSRVKREPKVPVKREPLPIPAPAIESRLSAYRDLVRLAAASSAQPAPDKLSPYLTEELTVTGIFRDSQGYGAFVAAEPTKLTFFVRPGMRTHDGIVREVLPTGIKVSRTTRYDDGSARQTEEFRALRKEKSGSSR